MKRWKSIGSFAGAAVRILILLLTPFSIIKAQTSQDLISHFESAGAEFNVPPEILKGIAFAETRWEHLQWADSDTASCTGMPRCYGVMALRNDGFFGHSLIRASELTGNDPSVLKRDPAQNIRGAAAVLQELYNSLPLPPGTVRGSLESWQNAIASYCGIPQKDLAAQHALEVLTRLSKGYSDNGIVIAPRRVDMSVVGRNVRQVWTDVRQSAPLAKTAAQPDYPPAHWVSAYPGHWYTSGNPFSLVVIHDMEGYYLGTVSYFTQSTTGASIHYDVNGMQDSPSDAPAGDITQQVEEQYWAWHAICLNQYSLGIEHEGFVSNPAWWTPEMYVESAKLVKYMCDKYSIPKDRNHIVGHGQWQDAAWVNWALSNGYPSNVGTCNTHTDPGSNWDWNFYMQLIRGDSTVPRITSSLPVSPVGVTTPLGITFSERVERNSAIAGFHISPSIAGTFEWTNNSRTLRFTPTPMWAFNTTYTVTIDSTVVSYLNVPLDTDGNGTPGGSPYQFTFATIETDTVPPVVNRLYPANSQSDISCRPEFILRYNELMDPSTVDSSMTLADSVGNPVTLGMQRTVAVNGGTEIRLRPMTVLQAASTYTLATTSHPRDFGANPAVVLPSATFTTDVPQTLVGTTVYTLDATGTWWQPSTSGSTVNVTASFAISADTKMFGTGSGQVTYAWKNASGGVVREHNTAVPSIEGSPIFGAWVFGDGSGNELRYCFYYYTGTGTSNFAQISLGPINWTGWKLKTMQTSSVPVGNGSPRKFASFMIVQVPGADMSGIVYFDEARLGSTVTGVANEPTVTLPTTVRLLQNYPNPFNPTTTIPFELPSAGRVRVSVYDMLGREVATLLNSTLGPGSQTATWNAVTHPSGVYFVRLRFTDTEGKETNCVRKIVVLK